MSKTVKAAGVTGTGTTAEPKRMYWGDNGVQEFWESEDDSLLVLRNHQESRWIAYAPVVQPGSFTTAAEAAASIGGTLQTGRVWQDAHPKANRMVLRDAD